MTEKKETKRFVGGCKALEGHIFYYGKGMNTKCVTSKEELLYYVGTKYSANKRLSLEEGEIIINTADAPATLTKSDYDALSFNKQKEWDQDMKGWSEAKRTLTKNLSAIYSIIWGQMTSTLKSRVSTAPDFDKTIKLKSNAIKLLILITTTCGMNSTINHY